MWERELSVESDASQAAGGLGGVMFAICMITGADRDDVLDFSNGRGSRMEAKAAANRKPYYRCLGL